MKYLIFPSALALATGLAFSAPPTLSVAHAEFVQTMTCSPSGMNRCEPGEEPRPVRWYRQTVQYSINDGGSQDLHPQESEITDALKASVFSSFDQWNDQECSDFEMIYGGKTSRDDTGYNQDIAHEDNINLVTWRDDSWPHPGYNAVALTTVTYRPSSGEILSADIEFNTAEYPFTDTEDESGAQIDFRNTLTHEAGHFLGLDHSPNSSATMFATAPLGEVQKRELHQADISGLCHIYPTGESYDIADRIPGYEDTNGGEEERRGWCSSTASKSNPSIPAFLLVLMALVFFRRSPP